MRRGSCRAIPALLSALAILAPAARGEEVVVQNDTLTNFSTASVCTCFAVGEEAAAWLTSPCNGNIVAVQILWLSVDGGSPPSLESAVKIRHAGAFPVPGDFYINDFPPFQETELVGPVLQDGGLNEFRFMDENNLIPLNVPISAGETFVVSLEFANDNQSGGNTVPSVVTDANGCQSGKNAVLALGFGWINVCVFPPPGLSGDWVIRAVVDCGASDPGACCLADGSCISATDQSCASSGGEFQGEGVLCNQVVCEAMGACCFGGGGGGTCSQETEADCATAGGVWQGAGAACPPLGSCLFEGACCFDPSGCLQLSEDDCATAAGTFLGVGSICEDCNPTGACCLIDGGCANDMSPADCEAIGGAYQGNNALCTSVECTGGCCLSSGGCLPLLAAECAVIPDSQWAGPGTDCTDADMSGVADACEAPPSCPGDTNDDGEVDVNDLNNVILDWGTDGSANGGDLTDASGTGPPDGVVNVNDLNAVIVAWGACP